MHRYVDPTEQLVTEIMVSDIKRSTEFDRRLGFALLRDGGGFVELTWEEHQLFLEERPAVDEGAQGARSASPPFPLANIRGMVPNVDEDWRLAHDIGAQIIVRRAERSYGLRDFTLADPDSFGVRFASVFDAREKPRGA
jgi:catechol 2,3-dioxygenase-like lactoylglutathione lyase family enzyme